jgi:LmbE family N-acetylglucosaminyl deacetylase
MGINMLGLAVDTSKPLTILCLGAHCDDIEIGCGGSLLQIIHRYSNVTCHWVTFCATDVRAAETRVSANLFLKKVMKKKIRIYQFRDGFLPWVGNEVKEKFEDLKTECNPDIIFTHFHEDFHQDHRLVSELTWNTFRDHLILEYEIPKYDGDLGRPNLFVPVDEDNCKKKIKTITKCYLSQKTKSWFTEDLFWSLLRLRGMECNAPSRYAEAFHCRKMVILK